MTDPVLAPGMALPLENILEDFHRVMDRTWDGLVHTLLDSKHILDPLAAAKLHMDHQLHNPVDEKDPLLAGNKFQTGKSLSLRSILMAYHSELLMALAMARA